MTKSWGTTAKRGGTMAEWWDNGKGGGTTAKSGGTAARN